jgi:hypothetical protein
VSVQGAASLRRPAPDTRHAVAASLTVTDGPVAPVRAGPRARRVG